MADEQGLNVPDGFFARSELGSKVKSLVGTIGSAGRQYPPQDSEPTNPENGDIYLADGTNWDPAGTGNAALVQYAGGAWAVVHEHTAAGGL